MNFSPRHDPVHWGVAGCVKIMSHFQIVAVESSHLHVQFSSQKPVIPFQVTGRVLPAQDNSGLIFLNLKYVTVTFDTAQVSLDTCLPIWLCTYILCAVYKMLLNTRKLMNYSK